MGWFRGEEGQDLTFRRWKYPYGFVYGVEAGTQDQAREGGSFY